MAKIMKLVLGAYNHIKISFLRFFTRASINSNGITLLDPRTTVSLGRNAILNIGELFRSRSGSKIIVREGGNLSLGKNSFINYNCIIVCRNRITIGENVQIGPGVMIFDHDHDFKNENGVRKGEFTLDRITIGDNVWIGANVVILKGTNIASNCVVGAGSVIKGDYGEGNLIIQKRLTEIVKI